MPAQSLNHYTIRVRDLEETKDFYCNVVGLTVGERPPLPFPGYWLYCGGVPVVHLVGLRAEDPEIRTLRPLPQRPGGWIISHLPVAD
jgi:catechol 2,3-dioxygenase-like lactoylglutathione lyase family enzyme